MSTTVFGPYSDECDRIRNRSSDRIRASATVLGVGVGRVVSPSDERLRLVLGNMNEEVIVLIPILR
jgi:hypothetical protein